MDPIKNPFSPGAGAPPPELVGRDEVVEQGRILLGRVKEGRSEKSLLLTGLRGVGKTVLLNEMERTAEAQGYRTIFVEAHESTRMGALLIPHLRRLLYDLDRMVGAGDKVRRGLAVLKSFIGSITMKVEEVEFGLDIDPEKGAADSGDLEVDLTSLFVAVGEAAVERGACVALLIDEIQFFNAEELGALIMAMHKMQQRRLPLLLLGAGLPILPGLAGEAKSYAERLFAFPIIGALSEPDVVRALQDPVRELGVAFDQEAVHEIYRLTQGYPYFLQEWGYQAWNRSEETPITLETVRSATRIVIDRLDANFFRVRFDRLTPSEKRVLRGMAELGPGPYRTGEVARILDITVNGLAPRRAKLIAKGMIYSPSHGELAFTVPLFDAFMRRAMPTFATDATQ